MVSYLLNTRVAHTFESAKSYQCRIRSSNSSAMIERTVLFLKRGWDTITVDTKYHGTSLEQVSVHLGMLLFVR